VRNGEGRSKVPVDELSPTRDNQENVEMTKLDARKSGSFKVDGEIEIHR
jgi:hypothetical protein